MGTFAACAAKSSVGCGARPGRARLRAVTWRAGTEEEKERTSCGVCVCVCVRVCVLSRV